MSAKAGNAGNAADLVGGSFWLRLRRLVRQTACPSEARIAFRCLPSTGQWLECFRVSWRIPRREGRAGGPTAQITEARPPTVHTVRASLHL